jgi:2,5-diamino-6-(ribosylamino)-4(3H)-pyrimidinone 5'-phosphate reductase
MQQRAHLAINMVATVDGRAAVNGTATGIGSERDRRLMKELRADADVVLHGAGTVRADPLSARVPPDLVAQRLARGMTAQPLGAIVTASGELPAQHPYYQSATRIYVLSDRPVHVQGPLVEVIRVADVAAVIDDLGHRGVQRILCEGGPRLNASLLEAGLVDELFFTLAPKLAGGADPLTLVQGGDFGIVDLELRSVEQHGDELFLRYAIKRTA